MSQDENDRVSYQTRVQKDTSDNWMALSASKLSPAADFRSNAMAADGFVSDAGVNNS